MRSTNIFPEWGEKYWCHGLFGRSSLLFWGCRRWQGRGCFSWVGIIFSWTLLSFVWLRTVLPSDPGSPCSARGKRSLRYRLASTSTETRPHSYPSCCFPYLELNLYTQIKPKISLHRNSCLSYLLILPAFRRELMRTLLTLTKWSWWGSDMLGYIIWIDGNIESCHCWL